jgi:integral membrane protein
MASTANRTATGASPKRVHRFLAIAEAITWTLLIIAMVAKHGFQVDALVPIAGPIHGFVFLAYGAMQLVVGRNQRWPVGTVLLGILTAVIPFATIPWERRLERRGALEGAWRTEGTDDPRDATALDRAFRWGVGHPILLILVALALVAVAFVVLLNAGPPSEWFA